LFLERAQAGASCGLVTRFQFVKIDVRDLTQFVAVARALQADESGGHGFVVSGEGQIGERDIEEVPHDPEAVLGLCELFFGPGDLGLLPTRRDRALGAAEIADELSSKQLGTGIVVARQRGQFVGIDPAGLEAGIHADVSERLHRLQFALGAFARRLGAQQRGVGAVDVRQCALEAQRLRQGFARVVPGMPGAGGQKQQGAAGERRKREYRDSHVRSLLRLALEAREIHVLVVSVGHVLPELEEFTDVARGAGEAGNGFTVEVEELEDGRRAHPVLAEREITLLQRIALEIRDFKVALDIDAEDGEMLPKIVLHLGLIQHLLLHAVAERALVHLEKDQDRLLALGTRFFQVFLEVAECGLEKNTCRGHVDRPPP
jgi:hypothetical protein